MADDKPPDEGQGDTLEVRLESLEKQRKGLIKDLQGEREQRHELEKRLKALEEAPAPPREELPEDIQAKINKLSQDPDGYIDSRIVQHWEKTGGPVTKEVGNLKLQRQFDRAYGWLAKQEKTSVEDIYGSKVEEEIGRITKENGLVIHDPETWVRTAYKLYQQEKLDREISEKDRQTKIDNQSGERVTTPPRRGQRRFTRSEIDAMTQDEFKQNQDAILDAQRAGLIAET